MLSIYSIKGIILIVMFGTTFVCSMLPFLLLSRVKHAHGLNQKNRYQLLLSLLSCSAGGVFMGTCIMDLFPDVQAQLDVLQKQYQMSPFFPFAEFVVVIGFLLVLSMEQIILDYKETVTQRSPDVRSLLDHGGDDYQRELSISGISDHPDLTSSMRSDHSTSHHIGADDVFSHSSVTMDHSIHQDQASHSSLRSLLLLFALSLHSVFEGFAVGLQSTIDDVVGLFLVVIFHKAVISFSLGLNLVQSKLSALQVIFANTFFSITAPIGVGCGLALTEMKTTLTTAIISGSLQGIACGTFLYVTFFEVLPHEMNHGNNRLLKLIFIILGFSFVCLVLYMDINN